jgi:hypothetical protein
MDLLVIIVFFGSIVYVVLRWRKNVRSERKMILDGAWRIVLSDPNYDHRRNYEERARKNKLTIRQSEGLSRRPG